MLKAQGRFALAALISGLLFAPLAHADSMKCETLNVLGPKLPVVIDYERAPHFSAKKITFKPCPAGATCASFVFDERGQSVTERPNSPIGVHLARDGRRTISVHVYGLAPAANGQYFATVVAFLEDTELVYNLNCKLAAN